MFLSISLTDQRLMDLQIRTRSMYIKRSTTQRGVFMKELKKLIDVKSIVTLVLVFSLVYIVILGEPIDEKVFLLFSNIVTMIITYFFTKKGSENIENS